MILLDENFPEGQREPLRRWRIAFRQIGVEIAQKGLKDPGIIPFLVRLRQPTFFSLDKGFFKQGLTHGRYCLVFLNVNYKQAAEYARRLLRHKEFDTRAKRLGAVIRVTPTGLHVWRIHAKQEVFVPWKTSGRSG